MSVPLTPERINSLFQSACKYHQDGDLPRAREIYQALLEQVEAPLLHYNLGLVHHASGEMDRALDCFLRADAGAPEDPDTLFNLALCRKECGLLEEACVTYEQLLELVPDHVDALYNLAGCCRLLNRHEESIDLYRRVLSLQPDHGSAYNNLAYLYQLIGDSQAAIGCYQRLLELDPEREAARHMLAALQGQTTAAPPESYVRSLFDGYSSRYEQSLVDNLEYSVPAKLRELLAGLPDIPGCFPEGIDLGCGTGLSGLAFMDAVTELDGVDLSAKMVELAREKGIYRHLYVDGINPVLEKIDNGYDFVLAADVFGYLGDLALTMELISRRTRPGGVFCFSTETADGGSYRLHQSGRFAHSVDYIRNLALEFGWSILVQRSADLRRERDGWISGALWIVRK